MQQEKGKHTFYKWLCILIDFQVITHINSGRLQIMVVGQLIWYALYLFFFLFCLPMVPTFLGPRGQ